MKNCGDEISKRCSATVLLSAVIQYVGSTATAKVTCNSPVLIEGLSSSCWCESAGDNQEWTSVIITLQEMKSITTSKAQLTFDPRQDMNGKIITCTVKQNNTVVAQERVKLNITRVTVSISCLDHFFVLGLNSSCTCASTSSSGWHGYTVQISVPNRDTQRASPSATVKFTPEKNLNGKRANCSAEYRGQVVKTVDRKLQVAFGPDDVTITVNGVKTKNRTIHADEGDAVTIDCITSGTSPSATIHWLHSIGKKGDLRVLGSDPNDGVRFGRSVQFTPRTFDGGRSFTCIANNEKVPKEPIITTITVRVAVGIRQHLELKHFTSLSDFSVYIAAGTGLLLGVVVTLIIRCPRKKRMRYTSASEAALHRHRRGPPPSRRWSRGSYGGY